jgi:hypothetical protein
VKRAFLLLVLPLVFLSLSPPFADNVVPDFPDISTLLMYGIVSVGPNASINMNSGPNITTALVGNGSTVTSAGGGGGAINGGVDVSSPVTCPAAGCFSSLANPPVNNPVPASVGIAALNEAQALSNFAKTLNPTAAVSR